MMRLGLAAGGLALFVPALQVPLDGSAGDVVLSVVRDEDDVARCSLRAERAPLFRVVEELARELELEVVGLVEPHSSTPVDVELVNRRADVVLEVVAGSAGLRAGIRGGVLTLAPDATEAESDDELLDLAMASYVRATGLHPDHALGAEARLRQGQLEELRSNDAAALGHYELLIDRFADSELVPEATYLSALLLEGMDLYSEADQRFLDLLSLEAEHGFRPQGWLGMARVKNAQRDFDRALNVLDALEHSLPADGPEQERGRRLERARAHLGLDRPMECLRILEGIDQLGLTEAQRLDSLEQRAIAFEGIGELVDASTAWLVLSRRTEGEEQGRCFENAVRIALKGGQELQAIVVCEEAIALGHGPRVQDMYVEARSRLGVATEANTLPQNPLLRLEQAEKALEAGRAEEAATVLETLWADRDALDEGTLARVWRTRAGILDAWGETDRAIELLSNARTSSGSGQARLILDRAAAGILEKHGRLDEAIEANQGRY